MKLMQDRQEGAEAHGPKCTSSYTSRLLGGFYVEAGATVNHNVAELQLCPDTQSLAVMTSRSSVRQEKNNGLMMTH